MAVPPKATFISYSEVAYTNYTLNVFSCMVPANYASRADECVLTIKDASNNVTVHAEVVPPYSTNVFILRYEPGDLNMVAGNSYYATAYGRNADGDGEVSDAVLVSVLTLPAVSITSPSNNEVVTELPFGVTWDVSGDYVSQRVSIMDGADVEVWSADVPLGIDAVIVPTNVEFDTADTYKVRVVARTMSNYSASSTRSGITFSWSPPPLASLDLDAGADGASVDITVGYGIGSPATTAVDVVRVNPDGTRWTIAEGLADGGTCSDPLPPLGVDFQYLAVAWTVAGVPSYAYVTHRIEAKAWVLNCGSGAARAHEFWGNPSTSRKWSHGGEAYHFADGGAGGGLPVWYGTTDRDENGTLAFDTVDLAALDAFLADSKAYPVMWLRSPFGERWRAHVEPSVSYRGGELRDVTLSWDAVRWEEAT